MSQRISRWSSPLSRSLTISPSPPPPSAYHRSDSQLIRQNLEEILDIEFPSPKERTSNEMISSECGVCYCYQLTSPDGTSPSSFPDQICSNLRCARVFHYDCLITWLQSVPTNKSSFGTIFGSCPYCQEPISAKSFK
jgi:E3 ubiquitin-protein ligase FANCL